MLNTNQGSRSLLARGHLQKGICLHRLNKYSEAQTEFLQSKELNPNEKTLATWLRKNEDKLPKEQPKTEVKEEISKPTASAQNTAQVYRTRHEWFQNDAFVTVEVFVKNVKDSNVSLSFFDKSLSLTIKMAAGSEYSLELDPLVHEIDPKQSSYRILSTKVEIKLKKKVEGIKWNNLEGEDTISSNLAPTSISSARKPKDWNKIASDIDKDPEQKGGDQALNDLFQQIYANADEDSKRAMMKSYVESNGTCLSTNWSEVGTKTVETKPPEGMIAKKYNQ
ncbi:SGS domain-domain-containing protein [Syncephalastrum racemosum]|uniref:SGS domain-domain-containing protein n=1 Tax=Syncephalastrum racemosum TaxID=13706 RepID=A0A1X2H504_SYNRA|nr:SGS domain-domain-containing protein [Syncephalastrum racemosum]